MSFKDLVHYLRARYAVEEGQTMAEYGVVLAVIAIGVVVALGLLCHVDLRRNRFRYQQPVVLRRDRGHSRATWRTSERIVFKGPRLWPSGPASPADEGDERKERKGVSPSCFESRFGCDLILVAGQEISNVGQQLEHGDPGIALGVVGPLV